MDTNNNFDRAKKLIEDWPAWKRDYQLTKSSECPQKLANSNETRDGERTNNTALPKGHLSR